MIFPHEIIDQIIDILAEPPQSHRDFYQRKRCLKACSLVSRSFLLRSQHHLFSKAHFNILGDLYNLKALKIRYENLKQSPKIAQYIVDMELWIDPSLTLQIRDTSLPQIAGMISPLRSFTLKGLTPNRVSVDYETTLAALQKYRHQLNPLISSRLTTLQLEDVVNVPHSLFSMCINLVNLRVCRVHLQEYTPTDDPTAESEVIKWRRPRLLSFDLSFYSREKLLEKLCSSQATSLVDFTTLLDITIRSTMLNNDEDDLVAVWDIIKTARNSLRHLTWQYLCSVLQPFPGLVDLSLFPTLQTLEIPFVIESSEAYDGVCSFLETIHKSANRLESLRLVIFVGFMSDDSGAVWDNKEGCFVYSAPSNFGRHWGRFNDMLLGKGSDSISEVPIAQHIILDFRYASPQAHILAKWEDCIAKLVESEFSELWQSRRVTFEYTSRKDHL